MRGSRIAFWIRFLFLVLALRPAVSGASPQASAQPASSDVRAFRMAHETEILREFASWLAIPNVSSDKVNIRRNAEFLAAAMGRRGVAVKILEEVGGPPVVYGEWGPASAAKTLLVYAHYDGQPVTTEGWQSDPWKPVLRDGPFDAGGKDVALEAAAGKTNAEWRIYARAAGDDKGTMMAALAAIDALAAARLSPTIRVKFLFEGEEEGGSPHLAAFLDAHRDLLKAEAMLLCDGPVHPSRRMQVVFGARGICDLEMTVYGPNRALHSGHYGNWAPNPAALLADLLAALRDPDGKILIPEIYGRIQPLEAAGRDAIDAAPRADEALRRELGLAWSEAGNARIEERMLLPAMNIRGLRSGAVGAQAQNAIPTKASASIDFRLVPGLDPARVRELFDSRIKELGYYIVEKEPDAGTRLGHPRIVRLEWGMGYPAFRTPMDHPFGKALIATMREAAGPDLIALPLLGGSIPMSLFAEKLRIPIVLFPIANHDDFQHGPNENLRLQNLWDGIEYYTALYTRLSAHWN